MNSTKSGINMNTNNVSFNIALYCIGVFGSIFTPVICHTLSSFCLCVDLICKSTNANLVRCMKNSDRYFQQSVHINIKIEVTNYSKNSG